MRLMLITHQLPEAPPPPKLPPPPLNPPLSLGPPLLLLQSLPPEQPLPLLPRPLPDGTRSMNTAIRNASTPAASATPKLPNRNQASAVTRPPAAIEPISRPSVVRKMPLTTNAKKSQKGLNASNGLELSQCAGSG